MYMTNWETEEKDWIMRNLHSLHNLVLLLRRLGLEQAQHILPEHINGIGHKCGLLDREEFMFLRHAGLAK